MRSFGVPGFELLVASSQGRARILAVSQTKLSAIAAWQEIHHFCIVYSRGLEMCTLLCLVNVCLSSTSTLRQDLQAVRKAVYFTGGRCLILTEYRYEQLSKEN